MAYTPTEWKSGDVITAEKLNNIEEGISESSSSDIFVVKFTQNGSTWTADKTLSEINSAVGNGTPVIGVITGFDQKVLPLTGCSGDDPRFVSTWISESNDGTISATTYQIILNYDNTVSYKQYVHRLQQRENS